MKTRKNRSKEVARNTLDHKPRFNVVTISGRIVGVDAHVVSPSIFLDSGLEVTIPAHYVRSSFLEIGDLVLVRGRLVSFTVDHAITGEIRRHTQIQVDMRLGTAPIRILEKVAGPPIGLEAIYETVEVRGTEYKVAAYYNAGESTYQDLSISIGSEEITDQAREMFVELRSSESIDDPEVRGEPRYSSLYNEVLAELVGRRGE